MTDEELPPWDAGKIVGTAVGVLMVVTVGCVAWSHSRPESPAPTTDPSRVPQHVAVDAARLVKGPLPDQVVSGYPDWVAYGDANYRSRTMIQPMLVDSEAHWFKRHHTMPRFRPGMDSHYVARDLNGVRRMTDTYVVGGQTFRPHGIDPVPTQESAETAHYIQDTASSGDTLRLVRTIPAAGKPVNPRDGITLVVRWDLDKDSDGDGTPDADDETPFKAYVVIDDDGHHHHNIPGWLCPTRLC